MKNPLHVAFASVLAGIASPVVAQSGDVMVMRRVIAPPNPSAQQREPGEWVYGAWRWRDAAAACVDAAPEIRDAVCMVNGRTVSSSRCSAVKDGSRNVTGRYDACSYRWDDGIGWSNWSSTCSDVAARTRAVKCMRVGGTAAPALVDPVLHASAGECEVPKPLESDTKPVFASCRWDQASYGAWVGACGSRQTRTVSYTCLDDNRVVSDAWCSTSSGSKTITQERDAPTCAVNVVPDGDMELSNSPYFSPNPKQSGNSHSGARSLYVSAPASAQMSGKLIIGKRYKVSFWARSQDSKCRPYGNFTIANGDPVSMVNNCSADWTETSSTFIAAPATGGTLYINLSGGGSSGTWYMDDLSVVQID